jgi:FtsZ-interacting cell division protein YlmF
MMDTEDMQVIASFCTFLAVSGALIWWLFPVRTTNNQQQQQQSEQQSQQRSQQPQQQPPQQSQPPPPQQQSQQTFSSTQHSGTFQQQQQPTEQTFPIRISIGEVITTHQIYNHTTITISHLKSQLFRDAIQAGRSIRLIFNGHELHDEELFCLHQVPPNGVILAMISEGSRGHSTAEDEPLWVQWISKPSTMLFLFGMMLVPFWFFIFTKGMVFTNTVMVLLYLLTFAWMVALISSGR